VLLRPVIAEFELQLANLANLTLWALDETCERVAELPATAEDGLLRFTLDTRRGTATGSLPQRCYSSGNRYNFGLRDQREHRQLGCPAPPR
jgi:hypothetical protein